MTPPPFLPHPVDSTLLPLFSSCFDTPPDEAARILAALAPDAFSLISSPDGHRPVSQGILIPLHLGDFAGFYLYALCTHPDYRGKGYLRRLLSAARSFVAAKGRSFLALIPANAALCATYERAGFTQSIGLHASADGSRFSLRLPPVDELPFSGDPASLYPSSSRMLPLSAFRAALLSLAGVGKIVLTPNGGWRMRSLPDPCLCFACDSASLAQAGVEPGDTARILPLVPLSGLPDTADPLPR